MLHVFSACNLCEIFRVTQWCFKNIHTLQSSYFSNVTMTEKGKTTWIFQNVFSHYFNHDWIHFLIIFKKNQNGVGCLCFEGTICWFRSIFFNGVAVVICSGSTLKQNYYWYFVARNDLREIEVKISFLLFV